MPTRTIRRGTAPTKVGFPNANTLRVDPTDETLIFGTGVSGTTEKTVVDTTSVQTLTNKTIGTPAAVTDAFTITGSADATKIVRFEVDSTAAGTNVWTFPDVATATFVAVGLAQTLTSKTLTAPTINAATLSGTLAGTPTFDGVVVHTGAETHAGIETHAGAETHAGIETHAGNEVFSGSPTGIVVSKTITFTEDATSTTHTGTVTIPAGATLHDIQFTSSVLWGDAQSVLTIGDAQSANGWFAAVNLAATDLLVGEVLSIKNVDNWGGKQGAYLVAATGVMGQATATRSGVYYTSAGVVTGVVTVTTPSATAGRSFMTVTYSVGTVTAATPA